LTLKTQVYVGEASPSYADYIALGPFQWARTTSPFKLLKEDDPIFTWREKLLNAFGNMARNSPRYVV
jgi:glutathione S-transferase